MHLVGLPLAGVGSTISPDKFTFTIEHVFFEVTVVGATVGPLVNPLAVLQAAPVPAFKPTAVCPFLSTPALPQMCDPLPFIPSSIRVVIDADSVRNIIFELSTKHVAIGVVQCTGPMRFIPIPSSFVFGPVWKSEGTLTMSIFTDHFAFVSSPLVDSPPRGSGKTRLRSHAPAVLLFIEGSCLSLGSHRRR